MIKNKEPLSLAETKEILGKKLENKEEAERLQSIHDFLKKVTKMKANDAKKLMEDLENLNIIKLKKHDIIKIVDFMPEDAEDIRKIFFGQGINLDENEINSILGTIKKYK